MSDESQIYLFATEFGEASLRALPHAVSRANKTKAKLFLLHVVPAAAIPRISGHYTSSEVISMRENTRMACVRQLEQLMPPDEQPSIESEFVVQFGIPSENILQVALNRGAGLIILGLCSSSLVNTISHMSSATAYEVVCGAGCPVLTVRQ